MKAVDSFCPEGVRDPAASEKALPGWIDWATGCRPTHSGFLALAVAQELMSWVSSAMADPDRSRSSDRRFAAFVADAEPRLRMALVAAYGPVDGREAAVDALSWAWENWDRLQEMANPVGYLYRGWAERHPALRGEAVAA